MPLSNRRGVSLLEVMLALVLIGLLGGVFVRASLQAERNTRATLEAAQLHASFDATLDFLDQDLADLAADDSTGVDLTQIAGDSVTWRATRGAGLVCRVAPTGVWLLERRWVAARLPQAGRDSLLLYIDSDSTPARSAHWLAAPVLGASAASCGGEPALRISTVLDTTLAGRTDLPLLLPARSFEVMQARFYQSQGKWWFGVRSVSAGEGIQPLAGPFAPGGFRLTYTDSLALAATNPAAVRAIRVLLTGASTTGRDSTGLTLHPRNLVP